MMLCSSSVIFTSTSARWSTMLGLVTELLFTTHSRILPHTVQQLGYNPIILVFKQQPIFEAVIVHEQKSLPEVGHCWKTVQWYCHLRRQENKHWLTKSYRKSIVGSDFQERHYAENVKVMDNKIMYYACRHYRSKRQTDFRLIFLPFKQHRVRRHDRAVLKRMKNESFNISVQFNNPLPLPPPKKTTVSYSFFITPSFPSGRPNDIRDQTPTLQPSFLWVIVKLTKLKGPKGTVLKHLHQQLGIKIAS